MSKAVVLFWLFDREEYEIIKCLHRLGMLFKTQIFAGLEHLTVCHTY